MGRFAKGLGTWARGMLTNNSADIQGGFDEMNRAGRPGDDGWDQVDDDALSVNGQLDTASAGRKLAGVQRGAATTQEGRAYADEHHKGWRKLFDELLADAAKRF